MNTIALIIEPCLVEPESHSETGRARVNINYR